MKTVKETNSRGRVPVKKSLCYKKAFYEILRFVIVFTKALHWKRIWTRRFQHCMETNVRLRAPVNSARTKSIFALLIWGWTDIRACRDVEVSRTNPVTTGNRNSIVHLITSRCIIWWQAAYVSNKRWRICASLSVYSCGIGQISLGLPAFPRDAFVACSVSTDKCLVTRSNLKWWKAPSAQFIRFRHLW
jgi:hypothetical protein